MKEQFWMHPHYSVIENRLQQLLAMEDEDVSVASFGEEIAELSKSASYLRGLYNGDECTCNPLSDYVCGFCREMLSYHRFCKDNDVDPIDVPVGLVRSSLEDTNCELPF